MQPGPGLILRINYADDSRKTWQTINKVTSGEPNKLAVNQLYYKGGKAEAVTIFVVLPCPEQSEQLVWESYHAVSLEKLLSNPTGTDKIEFKNNSWRRTQSAAREKNPHI